MLTTYNGKAIKYDGWTFSWQGGNRLTSMTKTGKSAMSFKYNDSGIRTEKKVGTVTTKYMLDGSNIVAMQTGTATPMYFSYDANGKRLGVKYTNGLYYLNARYYNPEWGRFITPEPNVYEGEFDEGSEILGYNVYAYCFNNPINNFDPDGEAVANIVGGAIGGVAGAALGLLLAKELGLSGWKKALFVAGVAAAGAALGAFLGPYMAKLAGKIASMTKKVAKTAVKKVVESTGRTTAKNLAEQVFIKSVKSNPLKGAKHLKNIVLNDSRWLASKGWIKMERMQKLANGTSVVVHFVYNTITGKTGDFKFK